MTEHTGPDKQDTVPLPYQDALVAAMFRAIKLGTIESQSAIYALLLGVIKPDDAITWSDINVKIDPKRLDRVKKRAWEIHAEMVKEHRNRLAYMQIRSV